MALEDELRAELLKTFDDPAIRWVTFERDDVNDRWLMRRFTKVPESQGDPFAALTERKAPVEVEGLVAEAKRYQEHILTPDHYHGASALVGQLADALQSQATELADALETLDNVRKMYAAAEKREEMLEQCNEQQFAIIGELRTELATLKQQLAEREEAGWLPIETALRDEFILAAVEVVNNKTGRSWWEQHVICIDSDTGNVTHDTDAGWSAGDYTHWRALPAPPPLADKGPEQKGSGGGVG